MARFRRSALLAAVVCFSSTPAQVVRQLTSLIHTRTTGAALDDAGSLAFAVSNGDPYGTNPGHRFQLFKWNPATGAGEQVTSFPEGVDPDYYYYGPSVTDDGSKVVFLMDRRLAMMNADGSGLVQLTTTPADILQFQIAGNGSRVVFYSPTNLTGSNPGGIYQIFAVEADGSGLRQLTSATRGVAWPTISDDGQRIAFLTSDGTINNEGQVAGILQDGSGYHLLTNMAGLAPGFLQISGNGQSVAFQTSNSSLHPTNGGCSGGGGVALVEWDGTGLHSVDGSCLGNAAAGYSGAPDITDDAQTIVVVEDWLRRDVFKLNRSGSTRTNLTNLDSQPAPRGNCDWLARMAGGGSRMAFNCDGSEPWGGPNPDWSEELYGGTLTGTGQIQLSRLLAGDSAEPEMTADGARAAFLSTAAPSGDGVYHPKQLILASTDGTGFMRLTSFADGTVKEPSIADSGNLVVFSHDGNPLGTNPNHVYQILAVNGDGTGLRQLTPTLGSDLRPATSPQVAGNGSVVVFQTKRDLLGEGGITGQPIYRVQPDGSGLGRITPKTSKAVNPRVDATGTWIVYNVASQFHRQRVDGTQDQVIGSTTTTYGLFADISAGGGVVTYESSANPVGTNADGNREIFLWTASTGATRQLTATTGRDNRSPSISRDGAFVYYWSDVARYGWETADFPQAYRVAIATEISERVGGLQGCADEEPYYDIPAPVRRMSVSMNGSRAVFGTTGGCTPGNADASGEVFLVDRTTPPAIVVSPGTAPTVVSWDTESGPAFYDAIRGDRASLGFRGDGSVDLGAVVCVADDSTVPSTASSPDPDIPLPGQVFFYLYRGTPGASAGPGSYGKSSSGGERTPSAGGCGG
jgi:Tol biopolymer transport system component